MITKKKVAALCKSHKCLAMQTMSDNTQWIGDGCAMYILAGIEPMSADSLISMLDFTEKDVRIAEPNVPEETFAESNDSDIQIAEPPKRVIINNREFLIFETEKQLIFINGDYLKPIVTDDQTQYFMRIGFDGKPVLCVKKGLLPEAVILGVRFDENSLKDWLSELEGIIHTVMLKYIKPLSELEKDRAVYEQMKLEENENG